MYAQKARIHTDSTTFSLPLNFFFKLLPLTKAAFPSKSHLELIFLSFALTNAAESRLVSTQAVWLYAALLLAQHSSEWRTRETSSSR